MTKNLITIRALGDNFIYLFVYDDHNAIVVDPSDCNSVLSALTLHDLKLQAALITHHHFDHTAGVKALKKKTGCEIISSDPKRIAATDTTVNDSDILCFGEVKIRVIYTPGHTTTSVCYYAEPSARNQKGIVFTGDTLFTGGCGRMFECSERIMWQSLQTIADLPEETLICPGHNYTIENYQFALTIDPQNEIILGCLNSVMENLVSNKPPVFTNIALEKQTNIFLRSDNPEIKQAMSMADISPQEVFGVLRHMKDNF